jgi:ribosomal protein S18 acetylase RimI-like enzyme
MIAASPAIAMVPETGSLVINQQPGAELLIRPLELGGRETGFVLDSWNRAVAREPIWSLGIRSKITNVRSDISVKGKREETLTRGVIPTPIPPSLSLYYHDIILKKILTNCSLLVACDPEDTDVIWGYVAFDQVDPVLHFVYVKGAFRRMGIGTRLLRQFMNSLPGDPLEPVIVSHRTEGLFKAWPNVKWRWNPYRMMI